MAGASSGTFALVIQNIAVTAPIDLNAPISTIISAIMAALKNLVTVQCSQFTGAVFKNSTSKTTAIDLNFITSNPAVNPLIQVLDLSLNGTRKSTLVSRTQSHSILPAGTFDMTINGVLVPSIPIGVSAPSLRLLINTASKLNDVIVEGPFGASVTGYSWLIRFVRPAGDLPLIELNTANVVGLGFQSSVVTLLNGSADALFFDTIPLWMTEIPALWASDGSTSSTVEVYQRVNGGSDVMKAVCDGSGYAGMGFQGLAKGNESACGFSYLVEKTPVVSAFSMKTSFNDSLPVYTIYISGRGFLLGGSVSAVSVSIEGSPCAIITANDSHINCVAVSVVAGSYIPQVSIVGVGLATVVADSEALSFGQGVVSIYPISGSLAGGELVLIRGFGFNVSATTVTFNDSLSCEIMYIDPSEVFCVSPPYAYSTQNNVTAAVSIDGTATPLRFTYSIELTPVVDSIIPSYVSSAVDTTITITGSGFQPGASVTVGQDTCQLSNVSEHSLTCILRRNTTGLPGLSSEVAVYIPGKGNAGQSAALNQLPTIVRGYEVQSLFPSGGSIYGGTRLTIRGVGFTDTTTVSFSDSVSDTAYAKLILALGIVYTNITSHVQYCDVVSASFFAIDCILRELAVPLQYSDNALVAFVLTNGIMPYTSDPSALGFTQSLNFTPQVAAVSNTITQPDGLTTFTIIGLKLYSALGNTSVSVSGSPCEVDASTSTEHTIQAACPNMTAGPQQLSVSVSDLGTAEIISGADLLINLALIAGSVDVSFDTVGSVLGGALYTISGTGFSADCALNNVTFLLNDGSELYGSPFLTTCGYSEVRGFLPPLARPSQVSFHVSGVVVTVSGSQAALEGFNYTYSPSKTPLLRSELKSAVAFNATVIVPFSLQAYLSETIVMVDRMRVSCSSSNLSDASFINITLRCGLPPLIAGNHSIYINVPPLGFASVSSSRPSLPSVAVQPSVDRFRYPVNGSAEGGLLINVNGSGFNNNMFAAAGGAPIGLVIEGPNRLSFLTPAHRTTTFIDSLRAQGVYKDLTQTINSSVPSLATGFSSNGILTSFAFDGNYSTSFSSTGPGNCYAGLKMTGFNRVQPTRMRFYPEYQTAKFIQSIVFECSSDQGLTFTALASVTTANEGWNFVDCNTTRWCTHIRYRALDNSYCRLAELKFIGVLASSATSIAVSLTDPYSGLSLPVCNISYADPLDTPVVLSILPTNGTSLGGTIVTLSGRFLQSAQSQQPNVTLNGIPCQVSFWNSSDIRCTTGYRGPDNIQSGSVVVTVPSAGAAISGDKVLFVYMDRWSAHTSWRGGQLPVDGDFVWIPSGQSIALDQDTPNLLFLLVQGALYLDASVPHISIDAKYIFVYGGQLIVSSFESFLPFNLA